MNPWTQMWLNYFPRAAKGNEAYFEKYRLDGFEKEHREIRSALMELERGIQGMLVLPPPVRSFLAQAEKGTFVIRRISETGSGVKAEGYHLKEQDGRLFLMAAEEKGVLSGVFDLLRRIAMEESLKGVDVLCNPDNPNRMLNHWDNMDGSIERGYSGESFFFAKDEILVNERTRDYARFVASIGLNGVVINNVNVKDAATYLIAERYFDRVAELSNIFADYGIRLYLSLNFASPMELGGPDSADPLNEEVIAWWKEKMKEVFARIPNLGGFLVKADSEGRPGPFTYGRTQADGANMLANIVKEYGAIIIWRCFGYNCTQDWRDYTTDRARAGYDNFIQMDGDYHENVILQIKNGPMDFQIREAVSPLLGG